MNSPSKGRVRVLWDVLIQHTTIESIMNDKGLAQIGDNLVNLCYSLAKSTVLGKSGGQKVRDSVLARAIRATSVYKHIGHRTDMGGAGDAFEAIMAWLWMKGEVTIEKIVDLLVANLDLDSKISRKKEGELASLAFQALLEYIIPNLPGHPFV
ncbi:MAG: ribonuclease III family protein [Candidatus Thorarchaeota archaeon]